MRWTWFHRALLLLAGVMLAGAALAQTAEREIRVGVYQNEPKILLGPNGQASGILGDLLQQMARHEDWVIKPVVCEWQACLDALAAGDIDLMPDVAYTEQRAQIYDFHKLPALLSWSQIYKRNGVQISTALDLQGKRIAVLNGSIQQTYLENQFLAFGIHGTLVPVKSLQDAFAQVAAGTVDAAVANRFYGDRQAAKYQLDPTPILFQPSQLFYATAKGRNADLLEAIDRHLSAWQSQADSPYFKALKHWIDTSPRFSVPVYVWWSLGALAVLLLVAVGVGLHLRREVADQAWDLQSTEARMATILGSVEAFIYIKDLSLRYQYVNRKVSDLLGLPAETIQGMTDSDFFDTETAANLRMNDLRVLEKGERVEAEETNRSADGSAQQTYLSVKIPLYDRDGAIYALCGISTDITKHKQAEEAIHRLAYYDPLTQLPNRRLLMERVQQALTTHRRGGEHGEHGALLFIDVDNFKDLNDTLGHPMGDALLRQMAARLGACIRAEDTLARQGGDEFVVMLQGLSTHVDTAAQQTGLVAQKILAQLGEPYALEDQSYRTSVSIGVTLFSGTGMDQDELLKQADLAMYQAKTDGRNAVRFFNPAMQAQISARTALEADLHQALLRQEFVLHYQPQVNSAGETLGMEALVRWQHPQRGMVAPLQFIPVAETSGLILPLGRWILDAACRQLVVWSQTPTTAHWHVAVNVSARQFHEPDFVAQVEQALQQSGARADLLELELTESQLVGDVENVILKMQALKAMGVRMALDDFGTGYSSLSILKRLPLDQLKIDQSFVHEMLTSPKDTGIVRAIINVGDSVGLQVIAEGVETEAQRTALIALGCTHFQGYLFGKPRAL
jgi:diguanylate cyclase (GGDEF)-like protein/PAS domain S-box-containing protein